MKALTLLLFFLSMSLAVPAQTVIRSYKSFNDSSYYVADIVLGPQIWFEQFDCGLIKETKDSVATIAEFMRKHPSFIVEVGVHQEFKDDEAENLRLSICQAKSLTAYLSKKFNIPKKNLEAKGYGSAEPVISKETVNNAGRLRDYYNRKNKRIELKILYTE